MQEKKAGNKSPGSSPPGSQTGTETAGGVPIRLLNPFATGDINGDGRSWSAVPVPVSDPEATYSVAGTNDLWHSDNLGVAHPDNSDIVSKLTIKATDNTAQNIATVASVATTVLPLLGVLAEKTPGAAPAPVAAPGPFKPSLISVCPKTS